MDGAASHTPILKSILKPWHIRIGLGVAAALYFYDALSSQFGLPTLGAVIGMSGALMPWWGWLLVIQAILMLALFEYVRRLAASFSVVKPALDAASPGPPPALRSDLDQLQASTIASFNQKLTELRRDLAKEGKLLEVRLLEQFDTLETAVTTERKKIYDDLKNAEDARLGQIGNIRKDVTSFSESTGRP
jgi:hypothetical protein